MPAVATAAPETLNLRVEGPKGTIYEGPITTDVHQVDAPDSSTHVTAPRDCDGVHNGGTPANPYGYAGPAPTAVRINLPPFTRVAGITAPGINCDDHALRSKSFCSLADQLRLLDRRGIQRNLVGARAQHRPDVFQ